MCMFVSWDCLHLHYDYAYVEKNPMRKLLWLKVLVRFFQVVTKVKESDGSDQRRRRSPQKEEFKDASKGPYYFNEIDTDLVMQL